MRNLVIIILLVVSFNSNGQDLYYVNADNGLFVRSEPNKNPALGKLEYGSAVKIIKRSGISEEKEDEGKTINGEWVEIKSEDFANDSLQGFIYDYFISSEEIDKRLKLKYREIEMVIDDLTIWDTKTLLSDFEADTIDVDLEQKRMPTGSILRLTKENYNAIEISQRYETTISIENTENNALCTLVDWNNFVSEWKLLEQDDNEFVTLDYSRKESKRFKFNNSLRSAFRLEFDKNCVGKQWEDLKLKNPKITNLPRKVAISKVSFKIDLVDKNGIPSQKIINFIIPVVSALD